MRPALLPALLTVALATASPARGEPPARCKGAPDCASQCEKGKPRGCFVLAEMMADGTEGLDANQRRANSLYETACEGGVFEGCDRLGDQFYQGLHVEKDPVRAAAFYRKGCDGGHGKGCCELAFLFKKGSGVKADPAEAARLHRKGHQLAEKECDSGAAGACEFLANEVDLGVGGLRRDAARTRRLFERACQLDPRHGCVALGMRAQMGSAKDGTDEALAHYKRSCDGGYEYACELGRKLKAKTLGLPAPE
ncbi:MAG: sel1 repeat family protein [Myxococcales bacterium]|nr:sel1 repeat family protein [Myxococcales bacterium]